MKLALQLAYKNLVGAGLRTWLNVAVLSFSFVTIIFFRGFLEGWNRQARTDSIQWEFGNGQLVHPDYDNYDPFSILDGHGILSEAGQHGLEPILIRQASIYPEGRMISILLKGINPHQEVLVMPTSRLDTTSFSIPAIIGKRMATSAGLQEEDEILMRWRDQNGTFDAAQIVIAEIFESNVPAIDAGQMWIPIERLYEMTGLDKHATIYLTGSDYGGGNIEGWNYLSQNDLLAEFDKLIAMKKASNSIMYLLLLAIALLAIFDTQVLSIFRRQKEIGTYISLGMTRLQVLKLFTVEGSMYSFLAVIAGALYGIPLFIYLTHAGIGMPPGTGDMGVSIAERIFPVYSLGLVIGTVVLVVLSATIVSFLPARKIAKMDPVMALKGKLQ